MTEILTSNGFEIVTKVLGIEAKKTYSFIPTESSYWIDEFEIWEVPESFIDESNNISEEEWCSLFPDQWFRGSAGTVLEYYGLEIREFTINGAKLNCWVNPEKLQDFIFDDLDDDLDEEREYSYSNVLQYCSEEWSVGQPRNICAICVGLAKMNNMTLGELFTRYMNGGDPNEEVS